MIDYLNRHVVAIIYLTFLAVLVIMFDWPIG